MAAAKKKDELSTRDKAVLRAIVEHFASAAEPVASQSLASLPLQAGEGPPARVSPATIRNTMAKLEAQGYLEQPHTSAGRVPTAKGLRLYLDSLMPERRLTVRQCEQIEHKVWPAVSALSVYASLSKGLSELSAQVGVVVAPRLPGAIFDHIEFVRVAERRLVVICVARSGDVHHKLVEIAHDLERPTLERMNTIMREFVGLSLLDIRARLASELSAARAQADALYRATLELGTRGVPEPDTAEVCVEGTARVVEQPEFASNAGRLMHLLRAVEAKQLLLQVLERLPISGPRAAGLDSGAGLGFGKCVALGSELGVDELAGLAFVAATYGVAGGETGVLAILGPVRMDYARLVPLVSYSASTMTRRLSGDNSGTDPGPGRRERVRS